MENDLGGSKEGTYAEGGIFHPPPQPVEKERRIECAEVFARAEPREDEKADDRQRLAGALDGRSGRRMEDPKAECAEGEARKKDDERGIHGGEANGVELNGHLRVINKPRARSTA